MTSGVDLLSQVPVVEVAATVPTTQAPPNPAVSPLRQRFRLINRNRQPFRPRPRAPPPPPAAAAAAPVRPALVQNNQVGN